MTVTFLLEISGDIFIVAMALFLTLIQALLFWKVKRKIIRLIPSFLLLALTLGFFISIYIAEGWDSLGFLLLSLYSGIFFLGAISMFAIWCIVEAIIMRSRKKHSLKESAEEEIQE